MISQRELLIIRTCDSVIVLYLTRRMISWPFWYTECPRSHRTHECSFIYFVTPAFYQSSGSVWAS